MSRKKYDEKTTIEKRRLSCKKWRIKNREKILEKERTFRDNNRDLLNRKARDRYRKNKQKELDRIRLKKYGITGDEFREILEKQGLKCPICNRKINKNLSVDHDHKTGEIRGLICNNCNLAIGNANDSPDRLRKMADYLEKQI